MNRIALFGVVALGTMIFSDVSWAQTGPDVGIIRRDFERAQEAKKKEQEAAAARAEAKERAQATTRPSVERVRQLEAEVAARPSIERVKQLEAEVAARPSMSEVETLRVENARLKAELTETQGLLKTTASERDELRKRLEDIRAAAAK